MAAETETKYDEVSDDSTDDETVDEFKPVHDFNPKTQLLPSQQKRTKQNANKSYEIRTLKPVKRDNELEFIQKCIGQIALLYEDTDSKEDEAYRYGTGTAYMRLNDKYVLIITCAHNLVYFDDKTDSKKKVSKIFFLPNGMQDQINRLVCIAWIAHPNYDPNIAHCANDIGIVLCYDGRKYYKKRNINIEEIVQIGQWKKKKALKHCSIFGYPVRGQGRLMGISGTAQKDEKYKRRFYYEDIYTYPGQSGSALYREDEDEEREEEVFVIYGIHIFGDVDKQYNRGVKLTEDSIEWIKSQELQMVKVMEKHKKKRKAKQKRTSDDLQGFLDSIGLAQYYTNFIDRGCDKMMDLKVADVTSNDLKDEFMIANWVHRKKILNEAKVYFIKLERENNANEETAKEERMQTENAEKERLKKQKFENEKKRMEQQRIEKDKLEKERIQKQKAEQSRIKREKIEKDRLEKQRIEKEKIEREKLERIEKEKQRLENERSEKERAEKERIAIEKERIETKEKERLQKDTQQQNQQMEQWINDNIEQKSADSEQKIPDCHQRTAEWNALTFKELKQKCTDVGLSTLGTKTQLIVKLQRYYFPNEEPKKQKHKRRSTVDYSGVKDNQFKRKRRQKSIPETKPIETSYSQPQDLPPQTVPKLQKVKSFEEKKNDITPKQTTTTLASAENISTAETKPETSLKSDEKPVKSTKKGGYVAPKSCELMEEIDSATKKIKLFQDFEKFFCAQGAVGTKGFAVQTMRTNEFGQALSGLGIEPGWVITNCANKKLGNKMFSMLRHQISAAARTNPAKGYVVIFKDTNTPKNEQSKVDTILVTDDTKEQKTEEKKTDKPKIIYDEIADNPWKKLKSPKRAQSPTMNLLKSNSEKERLQKIEKERQQRLLKIAELEREKAERVEKDRLAKLEKERLKLEKTEKERLQKEKDNKQRREKEKSEKERRDKERLLQTKLDSERESQQRVQKLKALEQERLERMKKLEKERLAHLSKQKGTNEESKSDEMKSNDANSKNDSFDSQHCHESYVLSKNNLVIRKLFSLVGTVCLSNIASDGVHKWRFKILKRGMRSNIVIGLWKTNHKINNNHSVFGSFGTGKSYNFDVCKGMLTKGDSESPQKYGRECKNNDVIEMGLDLNGKKITFAINDKDCGVAFSDIEQTSYRGVVYMSKENDSLELLV